MSSPFLNFSDATTAEGRKLWEMATKALKTEYDGSKKGYTLFKAQVRQKIRTCMWQDITTITIGGHDFSLVDNADLIDMTAVKAAKASRDYIIISGVQNADPANNVPEITQGMLDTAQKEALQSSMLHDCLLASITGEMEEHVAQKQNENATLNDGPILLKIIQDKARGKAVRQNMTNTRTELKNAKLKEHKWNVAEFNQHIKGLVTALRNNEEPFLDTDVSDTIVTNYKLVKHEEFAIMVNIELNRANNNNVDPDWEDLMAKGEAIYDALVAKGVWGKRTPQEEQLFALQAQVKALQALQAAAEKNVGRPLKQSDLAEEKPGKSKKKNKDGKKRPEYQEWHFKNEGNKQTLKKNIKVKGQDTEVTYYWCKHHNKDQGMWVRHKPSECKNKDKTPPSASSSSGGTPSLVARTTILDQE